MLKIIILLSAFAVASSVFAQETKFGVRAGLNLASIERDEKGGVSDYNSVIGFHIGAILDKNINKVFYIQSGIFFSTKGAEYSEKYEHEKYETAFTLYYWEIPLLASAKIAINESLNLRINAGPYIGLTLSGTIKENGEYPEYPEDNYSYSGSTSFSRFKSRSFGPLDFGIALGSGIDFQNFYLGINYEYGLIDVSGYYTNSYNRCLGITIGYNF